MLRCPIKPVWKHVSMLPKEPLKRDQWCWSIGVLLGLQEGITSTYHMSTPGGMSVQGRESLWRRWIANAVSVFSLCVWVRAHVHKCPMSSHRDFDAFNSLWSGSWCCSSSKHLLWTLNHPWTVSYIANTINCRWKNVAMQLSSESKVKQLPTVQSERELKASGLRIIATITKTFFLPTQTMSPACFP